MRGFWQKRASCHGEELGRYWKFCFGFVVPGTLAFLILYFLATFSAPKYGNNVLPDSAIICGGLLVIAALIHMPIGAIYSYFTSESSSFLSKFWGLTKPTKNWGPLNDQVKNEGLEYCTTVTPSFGEEQSLISNSTTDQTSN